MTDQFDRTEDDTAFDQRAMDDVAQPTAGSTVKDAPAPTAKALARHWSRIADRLRAELGEDVFNSWFARVEVQSIDKGTIYLSVPTKFLRSWLNEHYRTRVLKHWQTEVDGVRALEIVQRSIMTARALPAGTGDAAARSQGAAANGGAESATVPVSSVLARTGDDAIGSPLDQRFTFETFKVANSNSLAHSAAQQVCGSRAGAPLLFNPLYIHATVGRGKTHLLQAVASHLMKTRPERRVLYLTAERFMYRFVAALRSDSTLSFKDHLRGIDVLLIDDMQFLQGKSIQQEFCHTLNSLIDGGKQVVVAADRLPRELEGLDERVRSRLAGGLVVEMVQPEEDLRMEILKARAKIASRRYPGFAVEPGVLEAIAMRVKTNARDLEGVFNRLLAHNQFASTPVTLDLAEKILRGQIKVDDPKRIKIEDIQRIVAQHFSVSKGDLLSARRNRSIVRPRQIAMYLSKVMTPRSLPEIGRRFGGRDHTTVLHAVRKIEGMINADATLAQEIDSLRRLLED
ncbi:MAG: chromosomal replication initiator protein DnaA [Pseudomonadota bacterium]